MNEFLDTITQLKSWITDSTSLELNENKADLNINKQKINKLRMV